MLLHITEMSTKGLVIAIVGVTCVGAAAAGGFMAVRLNRADQALATTGAPNAPPTTDPAPAEATAAPTPTVTPPAAPAPSVPTPHKSAPAATPAPRAVELTPTQAPPTAPPDSTIVPPPPPTPPPTPDPPAMAAPPEPPPAFEEIEVKKGSVIGLALETPVSSDTAKVEDRISAHVTRDVTVDGHVVIPVNSRLEGVVTLVHPGGKFKDQARIGIRFTTLYMPDNTKVPIQTDPIYRDGEPPGNEAASKVGSGAVIGAILGAVLGGKKGAAVGAAAGAGGGAAAQANAHGYDANFPAGSPMTVQLSAPVTVTVARDSDGGGSDQ